MFCRICGSKQPGDALFCSSCGTKIVPLEENVPQSQPPPAHRPTGAFDTTQLLRTTGTGPDEPAAASSEPPYPSGEFSFPQHPAYPAAPSAPSSNPQYPSAPFMPSSSPQYPAAPFMPSSSPQYPAAPFMPSSNPQYPAAPFMPSSNPQYPATPASNPHYPAYPEAYPNNNYPYSSYPAGLQPGTIPASPGQTVVIPRTPTQRWLVQFFGPTLAINPLFGVILGSIFAVVAGALACGLIVAIAHAIAPHIASAGNPTAAEDLVDYALGIVPLHNLFRDSLQLFIVIQGAGTHYQNIYSNSFFSSYYIAPFSGLLIVPALFLVCGGYIAASTDFQQNIRASLWRGVLLAVPYAVLLVLISLLVNGCVPTTGSNGGQMCSAVATSSISAYTLTIDTITLLLFAVLWGALFGLLGASLKLAQGHWREAFFYLLRTTRRPQPAGMLVGGLAASGLGIALAIATVFSFVAYSSYSAPLLSQATCLVSQNWQSLSLWGISQGPLYALDLLLFSLGAPIDISNPQANQCFYTRATHASISLFGTTPPLSPWFHLLLAIPILSLFLGGRVSAAFGRVRGPGAGMVQGALAAVPFTAVMLLLVPLSSITETTTSSGGSGGLQTVTQTLSVGPFEVILWALVGGAVIAALGGLYQVSALQSSMSKVFRALAFPFKAIAAPLFALLDGFTRRPTNMPRSGTRSAIYAALLLMILLAVVAAVGGGLLVSFNQTLTLVANQRIRDILSAALVAAPCLLIIIACATALCRHSAGGIQHSPAVPNPVTPPVPSFYGQSLPGR